MLFSPRFTAWLVSTSILFTMGACSAERGEGRVNDSSRPSRVTGEIGFALQLSDGSDVGAVRYELTRGGVAVRSGTLALGADNRATGLIAELPPGGGYTLEVISERTRGGAPTFPCLGMSTDIVVAENGTTEVSIVVQCDDSANPGNITLQGAFNLCPRFTSTSASPTTQVVGGPVALSSTVADKDGDALTVSWFVGAAYAPNNVFATGTTAVYSCTVPGTFVLGARVFDGPQRGCARSSPTIDVTCVGGGNTPPIFDGGPSAPRDASAFWEGGPPVAPVDASFNGTWPLGSVACSSCQQSRCTDYTGQSFPVLQGCADSTCRAIVSCELETGCFTSAQDVSLCYCGGAGTAAIDACFYELDPYFTPYGPCRHLIEAGLGTEARLLVLERFVDDAYAGGQANRLSMCIGDLCASECLGDGPPSDGGVPDGSVADAGTTPTRTWPLGTNACVGCQERECSSYLEDLPVLQNCADSACRSIVSCELQQHCFTNAQDVILCYCGGVGIEAIDACFAVGFTPFGPCRAQIEEGLQTTDVTAVLERFINPEYAAGRANILSTCIGELCSAECTGTTPSFDGGSGNGPVP